MTDVLDGPEVVEVDGSGNVIDLETAKEKKGRGKVADESDWDPALIEECREFGLDSYAIKDGGDYRQLGKKKIYWLPLPDLLEFEKQDASIDGDDEFWEWFEGWVKERNFQTKAERTKKKTRSWDDWDNNWEWKPQKLGSWWSNWGYSSSGSSGSELTKKLAVALKAINTTVSIINDTGMKYKVRLASEDTRETPTSFTNYNNREIVVSPQALLDTGVDTDQGIEVTTGWGLHEASHVKYSESLMDALKKPTELRPLAVAHLMHNLLEDLRIEHLTGAKFPGFAEYFDKAHAYLWDVTHDNAPKEWGPHLQEKLNAAIMMTKWPAEYKAVADMDPGLTTEWPWWREWAEGYVASKEPVRFAVIRALEHLAEDEDTKQEMADLAEAEKELEKQQRTPLNDDQFKELLKQLKELLDKGGNVMDPCPSPGAPAPGGQQAQIELTQEQADELERLLSEEYQQFEAFYKMREGNRGVSPMIEVYKPIEDDRSKAMYKRAGSMVERLRSVFFFRKRMATETERLLRNGFVDEEELWRAGTGDPRVFERSTTPEETNTSVTMLVDASGSMVGTGLQKAQELANVMMACLRTQRGVRTRVRAHSTGYDANGQTCKVYRIWEPGDPDTRLGLLSTVPHGSNFDGFAIDWCAKELVETAQAGEEKLLIVLSDGLPAGSFAQDDQAVHYGGGPAMDHMKDLGVHWGRQGVHIVQIAIDADSIRPEDQARMFKHWIGYESDSKLLTDLTMLLARTFGGQE